MQPIYSQPFAQNIVFVKKQQHPPSGQSQQENKAPADSKQLQTLSESEAFQKIEAKIQLLTQENSRLNDQLREKITVSERCRKENSELQIELHKLRGHECEIDIMREVGELRQRESEKWRFKCNSLENESRELRTQVNEIQSKYQVLSQEVSGWKQRYTELDQERLKQIESTRSAIDTQRLSEINEMKKQYGGKMTELENNLVIVSHEYDKMNTLFAKQNDELDRLRRKCEQQETKEQSQERRPENDFMKNQLTEQRTLNFEMENKIRVLQSELERLQQNQQESEHSQDYQMLQEKNRYLMQENQKLFLQNENQNREIEMLSQRQQQQQ